jgi:PD-(D/E)XK endonuclease
VPNPKAVGEMTEAVILAHLVQRGDTLLLPFGNNQQYMVIDRDGDLIRAQCKTGRLRNGVVRFCVCSINGFTGEHRDYKGQADVFLVWFRELNTVYEVPVDVCGKLWAIFACRAHAQRSESLRAPLE